MSHLALRDLEHEYQMLPYTPFIANDISLQSEEDKQTFNNLVYTHYDGDSLALTPSCECGYVKGEYRVSETCEKCLTRCTTKYSGSVDSIIWTTASEKVGPYILPIIWIQLCDAYRTSQVDIIRYMCDPYYRPHKALPSNLTYLLEKGHQRSYKYFVEHFDEIIDDLSYRPNGKLIPKYKFIYPLLKENRDKIFTRVLPFPSKTLLIVEKNKTGRYFDKNLSPAIDAVILASEMGSLSDDAPLIKFENKMVKIIDSLATFMRNFSDNLLTGKPGLFRKNYFAGRLHFSARQVITSNHEPHKADELTIPWSAAVGIFQEHIRSKLIKPPYSMGFYQISELLRVSAHNYHPLMDDVLTKIIKTETSYKGFPCLFSRPPILTRGSIQFFYITDFTKDPDINTIKISPLVLVMPNADFDGDAMALTLLLDKKMHDYFKVMAPAFTILDPKKPNALSSAIKMPAPVVATINNWFTEGDMKLAEYLK